MERKRLCQSVAWLAVGVSAAWLVNSAAAQETLGRNKSPAQTFASDCAVCHKSPQGLAKSGGGLFGVESFLREHYTSSKESAAALANYLRAADSGPGRAKRAAKGDQPKPGEQKKAAPKPAEAKGPDGKPSGAAGDAKPSDGRPADIMAPERRTIEPRSNPPAAGEAKPAEGAGE